MELKSLCINQSERSDNWFPFVCLMLLRINHWVVTEYAGYLKHKASLCLGLGYQLAGFTIQMTL